MYRLIYFGCFVAVTGAVIAFLPIFLLLCAIYLCVALFIVL